MQKPWMAWGWMCVGVFWMSLSCVRADDADRKETTTRPGWKGIELDIDLRIPSLPNVRAALHDRHRRDARRGERGSVAMDPPSRSTTRHFADRDTDPSEEQEPPLLENRGPVSDTNALPRRAGASQPRTMLLGNWELHF